MSTFLSSDFMNWFYWSTPITLTLLSLNYVYGALVTLTGWNALQKHFEYKLLIFLCNLVSWWTPSVIYLGQSICAPKNNRECSLSSISPVYFGNFEMCRHLFILLQYAMIHTASYLHYKKIFTLTYQLNFSTRKLL